MPDQTKENLNETKYLIQKLLQEFLLQKTRSIIVICRYLRLLHMKNIVLYQGNKV